MRESTVGGTEQPGHHAQAVLMFIAPRRNVSHAHAQVAMLSSAMPQKRAIGRVSKS